MTGSIYEYNIKILTRPISIHLDIIFEKKRKVHTYT